MNRYFAILLSMLLATDTSAVYATSNTTLPMVSKEVSFYSNETTLTSDKSEDVKQKTLLPTLQTYGPRGSSQTPQYQIPYVTDTTKSSEYMNVNYTRPESCRHKCGKIIQMPCSCDLKCLIHNNCCEDIALDCPDVLRESHTRYGYMLQSTVECAPFGIFIIASCPAQYFSSNTSHNNSPNSYKSTEQTAQEAQNKSSTERPDAESSNFLVTILRTTFVSDLSTGFVYKNWDTYLCHANERSQPLLWQAEYSTRFFTHIDDVTNQSSYRVTIPPTYYPPDQLNESTQASMCIPNSVATCKQHLALEHPDLVFKCSSFISYIAAVNVSRTYYNNRYCALCFHGSSVTINSGPVYEYRPRRNNFQFSVLVSVSQGIFKLMSYGSKQLPWQYATCSMSDSAIPGQQTMSCQSGGCNPQFVQRPDGTCQELYSFTLAVADDACPIRNEDIKALPDFLQCYLATHFGLEIAEVKDSTSIVFDDMLKQTLYINTILVYGDDTNKLVSDSFISTIGNSLWKMATALKYYRQRRSCSTEKSESGGSHTLSLNSTGMTTRLVSDKQTLHKMEDIDKMNVSTMCVFSRRLNTDIRLKELLCIQDYTNDTLADILSSQCFLVFDNQSNLMTSGSLIKTASSSLTKTIYLLCILVSQILTEMTLSL